jgi:hypothetical protein
MSICQEHGVGGRARLIMIVLRDEISIQLYNVWTAFNTTPLVA